MNKKDESAIRACVKKELSHVGEKELYALSKRCVVEWLDENYESVLPELKVERAAECELSHAIGIELRSRSKDLAKYIVNELFERWSVRENTQALALEFISKSAKRQLENVSWKIDCKKEVD